MSNYTKHDKTAPRYVEQFGIKGFRVLYDLQMRDGETEKTSHVVCACKTAKRARLRAERANERLGISNEFTHLIH